MHTCLVCLGTVPHVSLISYNLGGSVTRTNRRNRNKQVWTESAKMVTAVHGGQDHRLKSPFLTKKDNLGMPSIHCSNNGYNFYKTLCDTGWGVNIMAAVTYQLLFGTMPLKPIYIQF